MNNLANILKDSGDLKESKELLLKATRIRPTFATAWMNLGIVQTALKQYSDAESSYLNAINHRHRYADCLYNLGNLVSYKLFSLFIKKILKFVSSNSMWNRNFSTKHIMPGETRQ